VRRASLVMSIWGVVSGLGGDVGGGYGGILGRGGDVGREWRNLGEGGGGRG
jgi:hypothetical protein